MIGDRRSFLKTLGAGLVLIAVGPTKLLAMLPKPNTGPFNCGYFYAPYVPVINIESHLAEILATKISERIDQDILITMGDTFHETLFSKNTFTS